ncbi:UNVERIFIED_CONTAM: hypothetical protein GTU68_048597, partial [Idotea baltica]|nr:hypothetical protein [Idotea baltica]
GFGHWELLIILAIVVIVFGAGKLPDLGSGLGEGIKNFKKSYRDSKTIDVTPESSDLEAGSSPVKDSVKEATE